MLQEHQHSTVARRRAPLVSVARRGWIPEEAHPSPLEQALDAFVHRITTVVRQVRESTVTEQHWDELRQILESLPLTTQEFGQASNRLNNSRRYAETNESGAAQYELRMLLRSFATSAN